MKPRVYIARDAVRISGEKQNRLRLFIGQAPKMQAGFWIGSGGFSDQLLGIAGLGASKLEALAGRDIEDGEIVRLPIGQPISMGRFKKNAGAKT